MLGGDWTDGTMTDFKWRHFQGDVILWAVRWYCRYGISYRDLEEMLSERGIDVDHTTIYRWVQRYAPEMEKRLRWFWRRGFDPSWRLEETYVKVRGKWTYLYRARSEEHTSELQSLMRITYAVFCLKKKTQLQIQNDIRYRSTEYTN